MSILARIAETKKREIRELRSRAAELRSVAEAAPPARAFRTALKRGGTVQLLAEIKRRSPSAGPIRPTASPAEVARAYERAGAAAVSVLTDREYFGGELAALAAAREAVALPLLRKDFILDPLQIWEARAAGADAVLLIVRMLSDPQLGELREAAEALGMAALVEVHDEEELARALAAGGKLIGINNRDLRRFETDLAVSERLAPGVPSSLTLVAESGIRSREDVQRLANAGFDAVLVGESLMRQPDVEQAARNLCGVSRTQGIRP